MDEKLFARWKGAWSKYVQKLVRTMQVLKEIEYGSGTIIFMISQSCRHTSEAYG